MAAFLLGALASSAGWAQIVPTGVFYGALHEGFELHQSGGGHACLPERVFRDRGDLCVVGGGSVGVWQRGSWTCALRPSSGRQFADTFARPAELRFDQPVLRFGGRFARSDGGADGTASFYDSSGRLHGVVPLLVPAGCGWHWNGWSVGSGPGIARVVIAAVSGPGQISMDDLSADPAPALGAMPPALSLAQGGTQLLQLDVGAIYASQLYLVLGSASGTSPGIAIGGVLLPLVFDDYTLWTLQAPNSVLLANGLGTLSASGRALAAFSLPPGTDPALTGTILHHASVILDPSSSSGPIAFVTNPVSLALVP